MKRLAVITQGQWLTLAVFLLLLIAYHFIFGQFFPARNGMLGHDYSHILPNLLDGYFWFRSNGIFEPFWFTPGFCGGQPALGAPESAYYSVAQMMVFLVNPMTSVYITVLLFASLGFWGFYLLLRASFGLSRQAAALGGALFMFNGFFIHRMIIGHFTFHGVMLIPWIAYFLLRPDRKCVITTLINGAIAGCMIGYGIYSGMVHLLLPCALAVIGIACVQVLVRGNSSGFLPRAMSAVLVAGGLSASKLTAALLFLHNFPRNDYSLPGITGILDVLYLLFNELFFSPADIADQAMPLLGGAQWFLERHEWEYGVTWVPLLFILVGTLVTLNQIKTNHLRQDSTKWAWLVLLGFILALPLVLNIYTAGWNAFLKQVPLIKSSSNLLRWFVAYIPLIILLTSVLLDKISPLNSYKSGMLIAALVALISINAAKDRNYYHNQGYWPGAIVHAWETAHASKEQVHIQNISAANYRKMNCNDEIAFGKSQLACYNPMFGYQHERFPLKTLHSGLVMEETNGYLNIKNPACYTYPEQNECVPGDHFTVNQKDVAQTFVSYKPFPFNFARSQKLANWITLTTLVLLTVLIAIALSKKIRRI